MSETPERFGRYLLLKRLGAGGGGDVHLARRIDRPPASSAIVVVKRLHTQHADREEFVRRFQHEAELATLVDSPHVTKVFELGEIEGVLYIVQEYVAGWPLNKVIQELATKSERTPFSAVVDLAEGALEGLHALHTAQKDGAGLGIVHRDIAPKNIMLRANGDACLIDLGIGKSKIQDWKTATGVVMGSPGYMAPEHVTGKELDFRADLFSMAVTVWELCALKAYAQGTVGQKMLAAAVAKYVPLASAREDVPPELDRELERALSRDPSLRHESALSLAAALKQAVGGGANRSWFASHMSGEELEREETEVRALVSRPMPDLQDSRSLPPSTIYASRTSDVSMRPRTWMGIAGGALVISGAAMIGVLALLDHAAPTQPAPVVNATAVFEKPKVSGPRVKPIAVQQPAPPEDPDPEPAHDEDTKKPRPKRAAQIAVQQSVPVSAVEKPIDAPVLSAKERVDELIARARKLRSALDGVDRVRADDFVTSLMLARDSLASDPSRISSFEKQLTELEHRP